jgi:integrase
VPKFTAISVEKIRPTAVRQEIPDRAARGLFLVVQPVTGSKSWCVRFRHQGRTKKLTLGTLEALPLSAARKAAGIALHDGANGRDPCADKKQQIAASKDAAELRAADSVANLAARFIDQHVRRKNRPNTIKQVERIFAVELLPRLRGKSVHDVTKRDVVSVLDAIAETRPILANRTKAIIGKFYSWLVARDVVKYSPVAGIEKPAPERSRERTLNGSEIASLWNAACQLGGDFADLTKLLLLTGQRRNEVAGMRWTEIDADQKLWVLPSSRTKNNRQHAVPLSPQAWRIIDAHRHNNSDTILDVGSVSRGKDALDAIAQIPHWTLHDLRRTCATGMAEIGVQPHIVETILNHASGFRSGVAGTYNRFLYATEKADAVARWANHIDKIVTPAGKGNIIQLAQRS